MRDAFHITLSANTLIRDILRMMQHINMKRIPYDATLCNTQKLTELSSSPLANRLSAVQSYSQETQNALCASSAHTGFSISPQMNHSLF